MGCNKVILRVECPMCSSTIQGCDDCGYAPTTYEDWYCYSDGDKHYCKVCWNRLMGK